MLMSGLNSLRTQVQSLRAGCWCHDGYAMWDSDITPWNAHDTGPCRDIGRA